MPTQSNPTFTLTRSLEKKFDCFFIQYASRYQITEKTNIQSIELLNSQEQNKYLSADWEAELVKQL
jgi:hypothetical protein